MWFPYLMVCILAAYCNIQGIVAEPGVKPEFIDVTQISGRFFSEDLQPNEVIAVVKAVEGNRPITYQIIGEAAEFLQINSTSGAISIKSKLDYERVQDLKITLLAVDDEGDYRFFYTSIVIEDANDNAPRFNETYYNFNLPEDTPVGYTVAELFVTDRDVANSIITVTCDTSTPTLAASCQKVRLVTVDPNNKYWNGFLILNEKLDFEQQTSFSVRLIVTDGAFSVTQEVFIGVVDLNDSPPIFIRAQGKLIPEGQPVNTYIDYVLAIDGDGANISRPIRYELFGSEESLRYFTVSPVDGVIRNTVVLDYEDPTRPIGQPFTLQIRARELLRENPQELGNTSLTTATASLRIRLQDINDNCPTFDENEYFVRIREDISQGSNIPLQMTVTDGDSGNRATFDLTLFDPSGTFEVTPTTARSPSSVTISVVNALNIDYETDPRSYDLTVRATENGVGIEPLDCTSTAVVHIELLDVNDEAPYFEQPEYRTQVREDATGGTILVQVTANDNDAGQYGRDSIRYSLIGSGQDLFEIDAISGVVTVRSCATPGSTPCLDYEQKRRYDLAVRAVDSLGGSGALRGTAPLIIDVLDVNDNPPRFTSSYYFRTIREGETVPTDGLFIKANDRDVLNRITYFIPPNQNEAALWRVNGTSGEITAIRPIQYDDVPDQARGTFRFEATASDGLFTSTADIEIEVIDINDKVPIFLPQNYTVTIPEDKPGDTFVIQVSVTDRDSPTTGNGQVDVTIDSGSLGKFVVKPRGMDASGTIITDIFTEFDAVFDYDVQSVYTLIVKGRDRGSPSNTGTAVVTVFIQDINNKNPYFDPPTTSETISENAAVGTFVTSVTARDRDADSQLRIYFRDPIRAFNPSGVEVFDRTLFQNLFAISESGIVTVNAPLDRDIVSFITFTLYVQDVRVTPPQEGEGALYIRILEYNDQSPVFDRPFYNFSVLEERPLGSFVGSLLARDEDDQIESYGLISNPADLFVISITSGVLRVNGRLDYETRHNVTLIAEAVDNGSPPLSATATVYINIININDNTPVFQQPVYQITISEHTTTTSPLIRVSATDKDEGDYGVVRYFTDDTLFRVDHLTGEIFMLPGTDLDRETRSSYTFQVTAYDSPLDSTVRLNSSVPVYVIIEDINDMCPVFSRPGNYSGTVIETADIGDQVLEMFATDGDSGINRRIRFTIDQFSAYPPEAYNLFSIQSISSTYGITESGRIEVQRSLRNKPGMYSFVVVASDKNGDNSTGDMCSRRVWVNIRIQEAINDAPIWVRPPNNNFSIDVLESQYNGMLVYDCLARDVNSGNAGIIDYSFQVGQELRQTTPEFRINPVTCVIRAQIVYDREQVDSYVLTLVATDRGDPSASSETVLIVNILDVNDNDPEFPMRNGETIPYNFAVVEGQSPSVVGVIGVVSATDRDTDHRNNRIFYRIVAGNDEGLFTLGLVTGELRLSSRAGNGLDREFQAVYSMDILAYNDVNDDSVIRNRRRRSTNPSIVTVNVQIVDDNDSPPRFTRPDYYGCVPLDAPYGQSILQVEAVDRDVGRAQFMQYSMVSQSPGNFFSVDPNLGVIRNSELLYNINSRVPTLRVRADDSANDPSVVGNTAEADVKIFVTESSNEVVLEVSQPSADVRYYQDQLIRVILSASNPRVYYVCIREIRDHIGSDGSRSYTSSDVFLSAVGQRPNGDYFIYSGTDLRDMITRQQNNATTAYLYRTLYVTQVSVESEENKLSLTEDPVLAIFIIAILLIFLAIILFCLACCLIRNSKKKKMKKLRAEQRTDVQVVRQPAPEPVPSVNPVYNNRGFETEDEYAVVKKRPAPAPAPPIIPVTVPAEEEPQVTETIPEVPGEPEPEPVPVIVTEPVMADETPEQMQPPPPDFFETEPEVDPTPEPETVIETEVVPEDEDQPMPAPPGNEIDAEIRDEPVEGESSLPPPPANEDEYRIETDVM